MSAHPAGIRLPGFTPPEVETDRVRKERLREPSNPAAIALRSEGASGVESETRRLQERSDRFSRDFERGQTTARAASAQRSRGAGIRDAISQVRGSFPRITRRQVSGGAAERAQFTRAKERTGQITQSALSALDEVLSSRGLTGPIQAEFLNPVIQSGQRGLSNVVLQQAIDALDRDERAASEQFGGDISQQSQMISALLALLSGGGEAAF